MADRTGRALSPSISSAGGTGGGFRVGALELLCHGPQGLAIPADRCTDGKGRG